MKPEVFLFPLQIAALQRRHQRGDDGSWSLSLTLASGAELTVVSWPSTEGWAAEAVLVRGGSVMRAHGAVVADRIRAEAMALSALALAGEGRTLPRDLRRALASRHSTLQR